jgi:prepilin-type N-terminal cleavage/methylation domain-containing protein/prepilin-type processing-associated H-X9-DG protein
MPTTFAVSSPSPHTAPRRGLTLVELLVVIGILALLAAILFPVFGRVRENSRKSSCASNLKQLGGAFLLYARDYDDKLPHSAQASDPVEAGWVLGGGGAAYVFPTDVTRGALYTYVKNTQVYMCPSDTNAKTKGLSYSMNMICSRQRLSSVNRASDSILLVDESATLNDGNFNSQLCGGNDQPTFIHNGGANFVFMDSRTKFMTASQLDKRFFRYVGSECP